MQKVKKIFVCQECGTSYPKWEGRCNACGEWNSLIEERVQQEVKGKVKQRKQAASSDARLKPLRINEVSREVAYRWSTADRELDRVLGGGLVSGSLILLGGQPGIGKSTLLLQMALAVGKRLMYVSGEESVQQIKMRAERLGGENAELFLYAESNIEKALQEAKDLEVEMIIIDSIQTSFVSYLDSTPGTVSQIRESAAVLQQFAKQQNIPVWLVGHINKEGSIAGPKLLEHIVDVVLYFEGDGKYVYRLLRTHKNRFGSTDEIGIYKMHAKGLEVVDNPSELLISQGSEDLSGRAIASVVEGLRPMLIEIQSLVSPAVYGTAQRSATGFDSRRLAMLLAVLEKRLGLSYSQNDVFLNIAGALKLNDPAADLAVVASLISSLNDVYIPANHGFAGEVGLSGEIRAVSFLEQRLAEAEKLGFKKMFVSAYNDFKKDQFGSMEIIELEHVTQLYQFLFI